MGRARCGGSRNCGTWDSEAKDWVFFFFFFPSRSSLYVQMWLCARVNGHLTSGQTAQVVSVIDHVDNLSDYFPGAEVQASNPALRKQEEEFTVI